MSVLPVIGFRPDVIHCHDWQTGLVPVYLHDSFQQNEFFWGIKTVMTIHNLKFQGVWDVKTVQGITGLSDYYFAPDKLEAYKDANFLKGGIVFADAVTTVSNTYAAAGGSNYENFQMIKEHIPLVLRLGSSHYCLKDFAD